MHEHVHGNHDDVHEERLHDDGDDVHDGRLHGYVPDGHAVHDAHVADVRQGLLDVRGDVHEMRDDVRADGKQR